MAPNKKLLEKKEQLLVLHTALTLVWHLKIFSVPIISDKMKKKIVSP